MKPTKFNITPCLGWKGGSTQGNIIADIVENTREYYDRWANLARMCEKQAKRYGGLDLAYLSESSTMRDITRVARQYLCREWKQRFTMQDDAQARRYLAERVMDWVSVS